MADGEENITNLAKQVDASGAKMEYHPSIRALVRFLARRAADHDYNELLEVLKTKTEQIIDSAERDTS
ncbi:MAG: hypothetical protein AAF986_04180 [Pseudomonadota bacterium]